MSMMTNQPSVSSLPSRIPSHESLPEIMQGSKRYDSYPHLKHSSAPT